MFLFRIDTWSWYLYILFSDSACGKDISNPDANVTKFEFNIIKLGQFEKNIPDLIASSANPNNPREELALENWTREKQLFLLQLHKDVRRCSILCSPIFYLIHQTKEWPKLTHVCIVLDMYYVVLYSTT